MKVLYASPNINHHNIPIAESFVKILGESNFKYAVLQPKEKFRIKMGFNPEDEDKSWVIFAYQN